MTAYDKFIKKKKEKRKNIAIALSLIIILILMVNLYNINYRKEASKFKVEKGILDLTSWEKQDKIIKLDGEWEFYSGQLIQAGKKLDEKNKTYIEVPGSWEKSLKGEGLENGSGSYRLLIKVPEDTSYAIKSRTIRVANRIYLNGEEISRAGNPSIEKENLKPESKYNVGIGSSVDGEIELIVHVTSRDYRSGGIIKSIELGSVDSILKETNKDIAMDALVVSVSLVLGLFFLILYILRREDKYLLYFSGANFFMALSLSTMDEQIIRFIYDYELSTRTSIQILSMIIVTLCFLRFIDAFFEKYSNDKMTKRITKILMISLLLVFNNPEKSISISTGATQTIVIGIMMISYLYMSYILLKAIHEKADSLEYILIITISMFSYWIILALKVFLEIDLGNNPDILMLIIMFTVSALMSHNLQRDYEQVKELSEKLTRYDKLKDDFLVKSSHEFGAPLEIILKATKNLLEGKKGLLNIQQQEDIFLIHQEGERLRRLTDELLDASLIKNGKTKLRLTSIEPYKAVEDILNEIEILHPYNDSLVLKNEIPEDFPKLLADADKFRQIIYDLVENAIKYTKAGEIIISAKILESQGEIKIKDTGIGIEEKYLKEIFDIFYQKTEEKELKEKQGLGLGLSIVKHLVEIQGGDIEVESTYGQGSSFSFTLPIYNEKENTIDYFHGNDFMVDIFKEFSSKLENDRKDKAKKETILIIDNDLENQKLLYKVLKEMSYNINITNSGKEALRILEKEKIDLVILDFMLADMNTSEICRQIRKKYSMRELPILILTASRRTIDLLDSLNYGINDFQKKPIDMEELKTRVQSLLLIKSSGEEGIEKEFQYFYSQISPHFLYNTLNTIIGLSYTDSDKTRKALNNLAVYLRGKLDVHKEKGLVALESELDLVKAYLEIEELRYGDRLKVEYNIEEELESLIPPLMLQPIVENAVYHGIRTKEDGGKIKINVKRKEKAYIEIVIEDNGRGMSLAKQKQLLEGRDIGIGFKNVMERLKIMKNGSLNLESEVGVGTKVKIVIPEVDVYESNFN